MLTPVETKQRKAHITELVTCHFTMTFQRFNTLALTVALLLQIAIYQSSEAGGDFGSF